MFRLQHTVFLRSGLMAVSCWSYRLMWAGVANLAELTDLPLAISCIESPRSVWGWMLPHLSSWCFWPVSRLLLPPSPTACACVVLTQRFLAASQSMMWLFLTVVWFSLFLSSCGPPSCLLFTHSFCYSLFCVIKVLPVSPLYDLLYDL